jgi:hypothetical protein
MRLCSSRWFSLSSPTEDLIASRAAHLSHSVGCPSGALWRDAQRLSLLCLSLSAMSFRLTGHMCSLPLMSSVDFLQILRDPLFSRVFWSLSAVVPEKMAERLRSGLSDSLQPQKASLDTTPEVASPAVEAAESALRGANEVRTTASESSDNVSVSLQLFSLSASLLSVVCRVSVSLPFPLSPSAAVRMAV